MNVWLLIHILAAIIAFGVLFSQPMVARSVEGAGAAFAKVGIYLQAPALVVLIGAGIGLMYDTDRDFGETWVSIAFSVWIAMAIAVCSSWCGRTAADPRRCRRSPASCTCC